MRYENSFIVRLILLERHSPKAKRIAIYRYHIFLSCPKCLRCRSLNLQPQSQTSQRCQTRFAVHATSQHALQWNRKIPDG